MSQEPTDIFLNALLRKLERHYVDHAARLFRAYRIPEPPQLPEPPESPARVDQSDPDTRSNGIFHSTEEKAAALPDNVSVPRKMELHNGFWKSKERARRI
jgi:hypothetical protein